jgi:DNA-directed RNA polymerase specialized sigma24 family protein
MGDGKEEERRREKGEERDRKVLEALARIEGKMDAVRARVAGVDSRASTEEVSDEELRRIYARVLLTAQGEVGWREAPIKEVFDFYCLKGFSAREVAVKLGCSKATVMNRLAALGKLAGVPARELRVYKPFFERMEEDLRDPRARRVRRRDAAYGDDPPDEGAV